MQIVIAFIGITLLLIITFFVGYYWNGRQEKEVQRNKEGAFFPQPVRKNPKKFQEYKKNQEGLDSEEGGDE